MIDGIMRKLGYINEKKLIDMAVYVYEGNDEAKAKKPERLLLLLWQCECYQLHHEQIRN